jgi:hypothetical protein
MVRSCRFVTPACPMARPRRCTRRAGTSSRLGWTRRLGGGSAADALGASAGGMILRRLSVLVYEGDP